MKIGITEKGDASLDFSWRKTSGPKILITKSPQKLCTLSDEDLKDCIIHCTITGLGNTPLEPGVKSIEETLPAYKELVDRLGGARVVLRIDPIILGIGNEENIIKILNQCCSRVRVSFLDMYDHVKERFNKEHIDIPSYHNTFHSDLNVRKLYLDLMQHTLKNNGCKYEIEICGEPELECSGCVSKKDLDTLGIIDIPSDSKSFQRKECCCVSEKFELLKNKGRCSHRCIYCYWKSDYMPKIKKDKPKEEVYNLFEDDKE